MDAQDNPDKNRQELHATVETTARLGALGDKMLGAAGVDIMALRREDIVAYREGMDPADPNAVDLEASRLNLRTRFNECALGHIYDYLEKRDLANGLADDLLCNTAVAYPVDVTEDGKVDFGVISIRPPDETPRETMAKMTRLPPEVITFAPGTKQDYDYIVNMHEARHIGQELGENASTLEFEIDADKFALNSYKKEIFENAETSQAFVDARLGGSLGANDISHAVGGIVLRIMGKGADTGSGMPTHTTSFGLDGTDEDCCAMPKVTDEKLFKGMLDVNSMVNMVVGHTAVKDMVAEFEKTGVMSDKAKEQFGDDPLQLTKGMTDLIAMSSAGLSKNYENSLNAYAAMNALRDKGYIREGTDMARYASKVDDFYKKYAPDAREHEDYKSMAEKLSFLPEFKALTAEPAAPAPPEPEKKAPSTSLPGI